MRVAEVLQARLITGVDSLLSPATMDALQSTGRLFTSEREDGLIPGEAAAAVLVGRGEMAAQCPAHASNFAAADALDDGVLYCTGVAIGRTSVLAPGLAPGALLGDAITAALAAVPEGPAAIGQRISGQSNEDAQAREFALAAQRSHSARGLLWCLADSLGQTGAAAGPLALGWAHAAAHKGYARSPYTLCLLASDEGERAAIALAFGREA